MNRSYRKNVLRTVKSTLSRFGAIFAIVALGVGFLAGLLSAPLDMRLSADSYYDDTNLYDLRVVSTMGLTADDLELVREVEGVESVLPVHDTDLVLFSQNGDSYTTRVHTLPGEGEPSLNEVVLQSGRMPEKPGECVVVATKSLVEGKDWIGETLKQEQAEDEENDGTPETLTVVGTVKSSAYLSMEQEHTTIGTGRLGLIVYTPDSSFDLDYYTGFYLTLSGAKELDSFGSAYEEKVAAVTEALEAMGEGRAEIRYEEIVDEANEALQDARREYEEKKAEAEQELADAEAELKDAEQEIADNEKKLADAKNELDKGWRELEQNRSSVRSQINSAQAQLNDGYAQIREYQTQLNDGRKQLQEAQDELDTHYQELEEGKQELELAKDRLDATQSRLEELEAAKTALWAVATQMGLPSEDRSDRSTLEAIEQMSILAPELAQQFLPLKAGLEALAAQGTDTDTSRAALEAGLLEYQQKVDELVAIQAPLDEARQELDTQKKELNSQQTALNEQKAELDKSAAELQRTRASAQSRFQEAEQKLIDGRTEYENGLKELADAREQVADGWKEYEEGKAEAEEKLADAEEQIKDAQSQIRELEEGQWYVFTRDDNVGYASYDSNAEKIGAIAAVFPVFFFLVAALVALTTMTRMVEEERQQIGTLKALGYSSGQIALKYLFYAAAASIAGSIFGLVIGLRLFPYIIINAYNIMYDIPRALTPFNLTYALFSAITAVACTLAATLNACWSELREVAASLMLPKAPKAGKRVFLERITPLWSRMKFTHKVTARNLIRYKKRFFMTTIGIAGCTALLVTGFGIRDSVSHIVSLQYEELNQYQLMVAFQDESALEGRSFRRIMADEEQISGYLPVMQSDGTVVPQKGNPADSVTITVPADVSAMAEYYQFRHRTNSQSVVFDEDSVIITEKLSERQHLKVGDTITLRNQEDREASLTITDICENYTMHYLYLSPAGYEKAFGEPAESNMVLCKLPEDFTADKEEALSTKLMDCRDVAAVMFTTELSESFANSIQSIDSIIVVIIICAGALAFVVLYNLTNINISERIKEIATIKVLGFYDVEVSAYIYRENAVLTLIGDAIGLVLGVFLHQFVIRTAELNIVMFGRTVYPMSYVWSALLTILFSVLVNLVMHRKLKKISMVESMKAPE